MRRKLLGLLAAFALTGGVVVGSALPAVADPENGQCENGEECFWPYPNKFGSVYDESGVSENHSLEQFVGSGSGQGHTVNDWAMSFWNHADFLSVRVCAHSYFRGPCTSVGAGYSINLPPELANQNSSHLRL